MSHLNKRIDNVPARNEVRFDESRRVVLETSKQFSAMKFSLNIRDLRKSQLLRVIAMVFLLHSGVDLLFPELCNDEPFSNGFMSSSVVDHNSRETAFVENGSSKSQGDEHSDTQHKDEDCFCCCTHVMPSSAFARLDDTELVISSSTAQRIAIPSAPSDNPYHPPRLA